MTRLRSQYRDRDIAVPDAADVPAETEAAASVPLAAASAPSPDDDSAASLLDQIRAHKGAEQAELARQRITDPPPVTSPVDDAIDAARADGLPLDEQLEATGLPPTAVRWLKANPIFLYDLEANQR